MVSFPAGRVRRRFPKREGTLQMTLFNSVGECFQLPSNETEEVCKRPYHESYNLLTIFTKTLHRYSLFLYLLDSSAMASSRSNFLLLFFLFCIVLINHQVTCDEEDTLLEGINNYRKSLNLATLSKNDNAECLADELADQFKDQPCTNTTGSNTVPGTEPQFPNYERLLAKCQLTVSNTRDGAIMPACVPNLDPSLVLSNFTQSTYSDNLNDTKFTGAGIGSDGNWIVVVLTTSMPDGNYGNAVPGSDNAASLTTKIGLISHLLVFLVGSLFTL